MSILTALLTISKKFEETIDMMHMLQAHKGALSQQAANTNSYSLKVCLRPIKAST